MDEYTNSKEILTPYPLKRGDQVCMIDPANAFTEEGIANAQKWLTEAGFRVVVSEDMAFKRGTIEERVHRLNDVIRNADNRGIFCMWGGYGTIPLLDGIDYEALRENRPAFSGFSDITAMHMAIWKRAGLMTFHGPGLYSPKRPVTREAYAHFLDMVQAPANERRLINLNGEPIEVMRAGQARGRLVGGNLTLISRLMGTPYEIDTKGNILFVEEVGEKPYRLHGMLYQLKLAGKLKDAEGIIIGALTDCDDKDRPGSAIQLIETALEDVDIPIVWNVRAGHIRDPLTMPLGADVSIDHEVVTVHGDI